MPQEQDVEKHGEEERSWEFGGLVVGEELVCPRHQFISPVYQAHWFSPRNWVR